MDACCTSTRPRFMLSTWLTTMRYSQVRKLLRPSNDESRVSTLMRISCVASSASCGWYGSPDEVAARFLPLKSSRSQVDLVLDEQVLGRPGSRLQLQRRRLRHILCVAKAAWITCGQSNAIFA